MNIRTKITEILQRELKANLYAGKGEKCQEDVLNCSGRGLNESNSVLLKMQEWTFPFEI